MACNRANRTRVHMFALSLNSQECIARRYYMEALMKVNYFCSKKTKICLVNVN